jgi:hypothetical protein
MVDHSSRRWQGITKEESTTVIVAIGFSGFHGTDKRSRWVYLTDNRMLRLTLAIDAIADPLDESQYGRLDRTELCLASDFALQIF